MAKRGDLDLTKLLPKRYRDKALDTLLRELFNRHLTKDESEVLYGYVGDPSSAARTDEDIYLVEKDLERQVNQLASVAYAKHATEERAVSWAELVQRLVLLGSPYDQLATWLKTQSFNLAPPIDLDKFVNFNEYFWVGAWVRDHPSLPYEDLGIPTAFVQSVVPSINPDYLPEYYVVERGTISGGIPMPPYAPLTTWSDWAFCNLWVHRDEALSFLSTYSADLQFSELVQAKLPIIEYSQHVRLSTYVNAQGEPADSGTLHVVQKLERNQPPLFDLYYHDGQHTKLTSSIFYFNEDSNEVVDDNIGRRIVRDDNTDLVFGLGLVSPDTDELLWYKHWTGTAFELRSAWRAAPDLSVVDYVKYDTTGTVINRDKFLNYRDYYWTAAATPASLPSYNQAAEPEYYVIERGGTSGWSVDNKWVHVSQLKRSELSLYPQAVEPIIEFNIALEAELLTVKSVFNQLPKFKLYYYDQASDTYMQLPMTSVSQLVDVYTQGALLAKLDDLPNTSSAILDSSPLINQTFVQGEHRYVQSFVNGYFSPEKDGITYGLTIREVERDALGNGQLSTLDVAPTAVPDVLVLTATSASVFTVESMVYGPLGGLAVGVPYTNITDVNLTLLAGSTPFAAGDVIRIEIKSVIFNQVHLYAKLGTLYRTFEQPRDIVDKDYTDLRLMAATPSLLDGAWQVAPALTENVNAETRTELKEGDLTYHFASIIAAQPGLVGSPFGRNNWRLLASRDLGLGGHIKQHNGRLALLVGLLNQEGLTVHDMLDLARTSYEEALIGIREFVEERLADAIVAGDALPVSGLNDPLDEATYQLMVAALERSISIVDSTETTLDDVLARPYFDTTMPIKTLTATLPYLALADLHAPQRTLDLEQNFEVIVHHDGHHTRVPTVDADVLKRLVTKTYLRSNGQTSPGVIGGPIPPTRPFAHQFWLDLSTMTLSEYNVLNDTGDLPADAVEGQYVSDRQTLEVWQYVSGSWTSMGSSVSAQELPWKVVDLTETLRALILRFEQDLFEQCPLRSQVVNIDGLDLDVRSTPLLKAEFETFAANYGIIDPYASIYDPSNAFTWNYKDGAQPASWHALYQATYGTARPDLEPWVTMGMDEPTFLSYMITAGALPGGTTDFDPAAHWSLVGAEVSAYTNLPLSVDTTTGFLLSPYAFGAAEQLLSSPPPNPLGRYEYGDLGPIELYWTRTTDYLVSRVKVYFMLHPLDLVSSAWGDEVRSLNGYEFSPAIGRKQGVADVQLHGEAADHALTEDDVTVTFISAPGSADVEFDVEVASTMQTIMRLSGPDFDPPQYVNSNSVTTPWATVTINPPRSGLLIGDKVHVIVTTAGDVSYTVTAATARKLEGLSQLYVHLHRTSGLDLSISANTTWLRGWEPKLGYRFNTLIDTDLLEVRVGDDRLDPSAYSVLLKETEYVNSAWATAMKVTLLRVGSTTRQGGLLVPVEGANGEAAGDDWLFRVDIYNPKRPEIEWWDYDLNGAYQTFFALSAKHSSQEWKHYTQRATLRRAKAPFLVTGIQALATFMFGYADRLEELGFRFNDIENPILDATTGRPCGYQLLIEQFIDQQFAGVSNGSAFLFNPFPKRVWYTTPFGFTSDISKRAENVLSSLSPMLLNNRGKQLKAGSFRVFRQEELAEVATDEDVLAVHLLTSSHEHVLLCNDYSEDGVLLYDPFLGQQVERLFFSGERQQAPTGRISYGGKFLYGGGMRKNMEASVEGLLRLYDSTNPRLNAPDTERARALLGFQEKQYFRDRNAPEQTEFRFWQGEIKAKGTNLAIDAYINSKSYRTAALDEFWAYKVAEYGDARQVVDAELRVQPDDCTTERTNYLFLESDELTLIKEYKRNGGYDIPRYDVIPYDIFSLYTSEQYIGIEYFDPRGMILITPDDEQRWFRFFDLRTLAYFEAEVLAEAYITPTTADAANDYIYVIRNARGEPVRADCFELFDIEEGIEDMRRGMYYEIGDYIPGTNPPEYSEPKFKRLNHSSLKLLDMSLLNKPLKVIAYAPAHSKYSPNRLYDFDSNTTVRNDLVWWDPGRGVHHPEAHKEVDIQLDRDPAKYNRSKLVYRNEQAEALKPWMEGDVGKVWWNTKHLAWQPYSDTRIFPDMPERLARWGSPADYSEVNVYEWVKADKPPKEWAAQDGVDGQPAVRNYVERLRVWEQRPVAWKYASNPALEPRVFLAYSPDRVKLTLLNGNKARLTLRTGNFLDYQMRQGSKISAAQHTDIIKTPDNLETIFGLATFASAPKIVVGSAINYDEGPDLEIGGLLSTLEVIVNGNALSFRDNVLGQYVLSNRVDADTKRAYVILTHVATGQNQELEVHDIPKTAGAFDEYVFDELGITLRYSTSGYVSPTPTPTPSPTAPTPTPTPVAPTPTPTPGSPSPTPTPVAPSPTPTPIAPGPTPTPVPTISPEGAPYNASLTHAPMTNWTAQELYDYFLTLPSAGSNYTNQSSPWDQIPKWAMHYAVSAVYGTTWSVWQDFDNLIRTQYFGGDNTAYSTWVNTIFSAGGTVSRFNLVKNGTPSGSSQAGNLGSAGVAWVYNINTGQYDAFYPTTGIPLPQVTITYPSGGQSVSTLLAGDGALSSSGDTTGWFPSYASTYWTMQCTVGGVVSCVVGDGSAQCWISRSGARGLIYLVNGYAATGTGTAALTVSAGEWITCWFDPTGLNESKNFRISIT